MNPKVLQILLPSGDPNGVKIIEITTGWVGKCFIVPRQNLKELRDRSEIGQPGLYFLFGTNEETGKELVYIGESETFYSRITTHDSNKDFWDTALIFTGGLNKAFVKYLEYKATVLANEVGRMSVENKAQPQPNSLSEFELVTVNEYFINIQFILATFQYEIFDRINDSVKDDKLYVLKGEDFDALGYILNDGSFVIQKKSLAKVKEANSFTGWAKVARKQFKEEGKLIDSGDGKTLMFMTNIVFKSPSAAAATVAGRAINGWTAWKDEQGNTLDKNLRE